MKPTLAFPLCIIAFATSFVVSTESQLPVIWIMIAVTALWAAYDSDRVGLRRYKTELSHGPIMVFLACAVLWILCFPWYLTLRHRIKSGTVMLRDGVKNANT